jgi:DNA anti-recombination protein RmuC
MKLVSLELLYPQVSEAIRRAETLEDLRDPGASSAYLDVSLIEERIAEALPATDPEGALARRGAVRAALSANDFARAQQLVEKFLAEAGDNTELQAELLQFSADLYRQLATTRPDAFRSDLASQIELNKVRADAERLKAKRTFEMWGDRFDEKLAAALHRLGVPTREEIWTMTQKVEEFNA